LDRGRILYPPTHRSQILFLLLRGQMRLYKSGEGREITVGVVGAGEMLGEAAFSARYQGSYAQAMQASEVALISCKTSCSLVRDRPEVGLKAMELLSERLSFCEDRMADMGLKEIPARLAALVLHLCESEGLVTVEGYKIPTRYTHQQLGAMIGSKRVATTRALGKLQKIGAVELKQRYIYVRDVKTLEHLSGR
jgi:CRP/FNR family transcriptional regulator, cyclic AMP receptor protein